MPSKTKGFFCAGNVFTREFTHFQSDTLLCSSHLRTAIAASICGYHGGKIELGHPSLTWKFAN